MSSRPSLLLITVDCLRADHAGFLGYERLTTPFMDSLAGEALVFRNAIAAGVPTYYSIPAIMASRHSLALCRDVIGIAPQEPTLASACRDSGYATGAFLAGNPYLLKRFGYQAGFDTYVNFLESETHTASFRPVVSPQNDRLPSALNRSLQRWCHKAGPVGRVYDELYFRYCQRIAPGTAPSFDDLRRFPAADVIVDRARDWLAKVAGRPFFLWLHFMDPHFPYYPAAEALQLLGCPHLDAPRARYLNSYWGRDLNPRRLSRHRDEILQLYDAGIRWVDTQIVRLVNELRQFGLWDKCVMAFTADHGEEFLDHAGRFHPPSNIYRELSRVPLLIRVPGLESQKSVETPLSLIDLAPTLLEIADIPSPVNFRGRSRWGNLQNDKTWEEPAITECVSTCLDPFRLESRLGPRILSVREARFKLIVDYASSNAWLFDLDTDPQELTPLPAGAETPVRRRLLEWIRAHLADSRRSRDDDSRLAARLGELRLEWARLGAPNQTNSIERIR
jgi:arylsulfatase A-like enzyme